ncbi:unnamed protein product [Caenorhabditis brenneri]
MAPIDVDAPLSAAIKRSKTGNKFKSSPNNDFTNNFDKKSNLVKPSEGSKKVKKTVRFSDDLSMQINISNLAPTVNTDDLRELFNEYNVENVSVYSDQNGQPTGDVTVSKHSGDRLIRDFKGVSIYEKELKNEKELKLTIIGNKSILSRISLPNGKQLTSRNYHQTSFNAKKSNRTKKIKKEKASMKISVEQLDAELEAYMNNA